MKKFKKKILAISCLAIILIGSLIQIQNTVVFTNEFKKNYVDNKGVQNADDNSIFSHINEDNDRIPTFFDWVENKTFGFKSGVILQARLLTYNLKSLENKKINFYMETDWGYNHYLGFNYTDSSGVAVFQIDDLSYYHNGDHQYQVIFEGDENYCETSASATITIVYNLWYSDPALALSEILNYHEQRIGFKFRAIQKKGWFGHLDKLVKIKYTASYGILGIGMKPDGKIEAGWRLSYETIHTGQFNIPHPYDYSGEIIYNPTEDLKVDMTIHQTIISVLKNIYKGGTYYFYLRYNVKLYDDNSFAIGEKVYDEKDLFIYPRGFDPYWEQYDFGELGDEPITGRYLPDDDPDPPEYAEIPRGTINLPTMDTAGINLNFRYKDQSGYTLHVEVLFQKPGHIIPYKTQTFDRGSGSFYLNTVHIPHIDYADKAGYSLRVKWSARDKDDIIRGLGDTEVDEGDIIYCRFIQISEPLILFKKFYHLDDPSRIPIGYMDYPIYAHEPHQFEYTIYNPNPVSIIVTQIEIAPQLSGYNPYKLLDEPYETYTIESGGQFNTYSKDAFEFTVPKSLITDTLLEVNFIIQMDWKIESGESDINIAEPTAYYKKLEIPNISYKFGDNSQWKPIGSSLEEFIMELKRDDVPGLKSETHFYVRLINTNKRFPLDCEYQSSETVQTIDRTDLLTDTGSTNFKLNIPPGETGYVQYLLKVKDASVFKHAAKDLMLMDHLKDTAVNILTRVLAKAAPAFCLKLSFMDLVADWEMLEEIFANTEWLNIMEYEIQNLECIYLNTDMEVEESEVTPPSLPKARIILKPSDTQTSHLHAYFIIKFCADITSLVSEVASIAIAVAPDLYSKGAVAAIAVVGFIATAVLELIAHCLQHACDYDDPLEEWKEKVQPKYFSHSNFNWSGIEALQAAEQLINDTKDLYDSIGTFFGNFDGFYTSNNRRSAALAALSTDSEAIDWLTYHTIEMQNYSIKITDNIGDVADKISIWHENVLNLFNETETEILNETTVDLAIDQLAYKEYPEIVEPFVNTLVNQTAHSNFNITFEDLEPSFNATSDSFSVGGIKNATNNLRPMVKGMELVYNDLSLGITNDLVQSLNDTIEPISIDKNDINQLNTTWEKCLNAFDQGDYALAHSYALDHYYLALKILANTRNNTFLDPIIAQTKSKLEKIEQLRNIEFGENIPEELRVQYNSDTTKIELPLIIYNKGFSDTISLSIENLPNGWIYETKLLKFNNFETKVIKLVIEGPIDRIQGLYPLIINASSISNSSIVELRHLIVKVDDDFTGPKVNILQQGVYPGYWELTFEDAEHPNSISAQFQVNNGPLIEISNTSIPFKVDIPFELGTHKLTVFARNGDDDYEGDEETTIISTSFHVEHIPPWWNLIEDRDLEEAGTWSHAVNLWAYASDDKRTPNELNYEIVSISNPEISAVIEENHYINLNVDVIEWTGVCEINLSVSDELFTSYTSFHVIVTDDDELPPIILIEAIDSFTDENPGNWYVYAEDSSGIYEIGLTIDGKEILFTQDDFGTDVIAELVIPIDNSIGMHECYGYALDADDERGVVDMLISDHDPVYVNIMDDDDSPPIIEYIYTGDGTDGNPGEIIVTANDESGLLVDPSGSYSVPIALGTHIFIFSATDNDQDREYDTLTTQVEISITILDDDTITPQIDLQYIGSNSDNNPGYFLWNIEDYDNGIGGDSDSGFSDLNIRVAYISSEGLPNEEYIVSPSETGYWELPPFLGIYTIYISATDNDNDRTIFVDSLTTELISEETIEDDDIDPPEISNLEITPGVFEINVSFTATDKSGIKDMIILVNSTVIEPIGQSQDGNNYFFTLANQWLFERGYSIVEVLVEDGDEDRPNDSLISSISGSFKNVLYQMYELVDWQLKELIRFIEENLSSKVSSKIVKKLSQAQEKLIDAFDLIENGTITCGLLKAYLAKIYISIAEHKIKVYNKKDWINDTNASYIIQSLHEIRNNIVYLKGASTGVKYAVDISHIEAELLDLYDFALENIPSMSVIFAIRVAAEFLELSIIEISLDEDPKDLLDLLDYAQYKLERAIRKIDHLLRKERISQELADYMKNEISQHIEAIELVKESLDYNEPPPFENTETSINLRNDNSEGYVSSTIAPKEHGYMIIFQQLIFLGISLILILQNLFLRLKKFNKY